MATDQHIQVMLKMMKKQIKQFNILRTENKELRSTITNDNKPKNGPDHRQKQHPKTKAADRPTVNTNTD